MQATPKLAHIVLMTNRLEEMRDWYATVLGAHVVYENPGLCFMTFDDEHHRIAFVAPPVPLTPRTPTTACMHHSAYSFAALRDLLEGYAHLKAAGIEPLTPIQHGVTTSLYYRDPDGNEVELQVNNFATAEECKAYFKSPEYCANPIGNSFDVELFVKGYRAGRPFEDIMQEAVAAAKIEQA